MVDKIINYLRHEVNGFLVICIFIFGLISFNLFYHIGVAILFTKILSFNIPPIKAGLTILKWNFPFLLFLFAATEELLFRFFPLYSSVEAYGISKKVLLYAIGASIIFGLLHGSFFNIFIQGVSGFLYCLLFLKCGGFQKKYIRAFFVTTTSHFFFNGSVAVICLLKGVTQF